jgi:hypothetical protein
VCLHLGELLSGCSGAGHDRTVLKSLLGTSGVADKLLLLTDVLGLLMDVDLLLILDIFLLLVESGSLELLLLLLQSRKLRLDLGVDEVGNVLSVEHLGNNVVLPVVVLEKVKVLEVDVEDTGTSVLGFDIAEETGTVGVVDIVLGLVEDSVGNIGLGLGTGHGARDVDTVEDVDGLLGSGGSHGVLELLLDTDGEKTVTGGVTDIHNSLLGVARELQHLNLSGLGDGLQHGLLLVVKVLGSHGVNLVDDEEDDLVGEEGLDGVEKLNLGLHGVSTLLRQIDKVHDRRAQVGNGGNRLHLNGVHLLQGVVENSGGVDSLESKVLVVEMSNVQGLGGESVRLNVDIGASDALEETGLSDVGVSTDQEGTGVGVNGRKTSQVLTDLLEVLKGTLKTLGDGGHTSQTSTLKLLALEKRLRVLDKTDVVTSDLLDKVLRGRELSQSNAEMVGIVEGVHQGAVERVDILQAREGLEDC